MTINVLFQVRINSQFLVHEISSAWTWKFGKWYNIPPPRADRLPDRPYAILLPSPSRPFYNFGASRSGDRVFFVAQERHIIWILNLQSCEKVGQAGSTPFSFFVHLNDYPTDPFTISVLQNPSHDDPELHKIRWSPDRGALILWKSRSGSVIAWWSYYVQCVFHFTEFPNDMSITRYHSPVWAFRRFLASFHFLFNCLSARSWFLSIDLWESGIPTEQLTSYVPQNPSIDVSEVHKARLSQDFKASISGARRGQLEVVVHVEEWNIALADEPQPNIPKF